MLIKDNKRLKNIFVFGIYAVCFLSFLFLTFYNLGNFSVENWDEARHGISAYEMIQNNNYIVNTFDYETDLWNLKPPLSFWTESASFLTLGYNLFAFRLSSAIAFTLMFAAICVFLHKNYGFVSTVSFMIIFQSFGDLFFIHLGRSGDADALFNLFFVVAIIALYYAQKNNIYLYISGLMFSFAFLSKSFHAANIFAIIIGYIILSKKYKELKLKNYLFLFIFSFLPILIWGGVRYCYDGLDFLGSMFGVDVVNRVSDSSQPSNVLFLLKYLLTYRITQVVIGFIIISFIVLIYRRKINKNTLIGNNSKLYLLWFAIPFFVYNLSSASLTWYFYPILICLITVASIVIAKTFKELVKNWKKYKFNKKIAEIVYSLMITMGAVFILISIYSNYKTVISYEINFEQSAMIEFMSSTEKYSNANGYILKDENSYRDLDEWEQADILVAELYGNLKCVDGGIEGFIADDSEAILIISEEQYNNNSVLLSNYEVADQNDEYILIYKE